MPRLASCLVSVACIAPVAAQATWTTLPLPTALQPNLPRLSFEANASRLVMASGFPGIGSSPSTFVLQGASFVPAGNIYYYDSALAFDAARSVTVSFGGWNLDASYNNYQVNYTQVGSGGVFVIVQPRTAPPPRQNHSMAYDPIRQRVVMGFGFTSTSTLPPGGVRNDIWEWDGTDWTQVASGPGARHWTAMAFDPNQSAVLLHGGTTFNTANLGDTWTWNGTAWQQRSPAHSPGIIANHALVTDIDRQRVVLIGPTSNGIWEWDGTDWIAKPQAPVPGGFLLLPGVAYDSAQRRVLVFGGTDGISNTNRFAAYQTPNPAQFTPYGSGCPGGAGTPALSHQPYSLPWIGDTFRAQVASLPATAGGAAFVVGLAGTPPVSLASIGLPGCNAFVQLDAVRFVPVVSGAAVDPIAIPDAAGFAGLHLFMQAAVLDSAATGGLALSNAAELVLGIR